MNNGSEFSHRRITSRSNAKRRHACSGKQSGFVLATLAVLLIFLVASVGLAVDFGTAFVARNEAQTYCDSAALAAALELDGTNAGIDRARQRALAVANRWLFGNNQFGGVVVEFAQVADGPWEASPGSPAGFGFARVSTGASVPMVFLPLVTQEQVAQLQSAAVAGQLLKTTFNEGVFPYSPFAHDPSDISVNANGNVEGHLGFTPGVSYTLRWPNNMNKHAKPCPGDEGTHTVDIKIEAGESIQGYIDNNSAAAIRAAILTNEQDGDRSYTIGDALFMANGNKQTEERAMQERVLQDSDTSSTTYAEYSSGGLGNGRRLVIVPINGGPTDNFRILGFAQFFLGQAKDYQVSPSDSFCAEYVGSAIVGGTNGGSNPGAAAYAVRLVR